MPHDSGTPTSRDSQQQCAFQNAIRGTAVSLLESLALVWLIGSLYSGPCDIGTGPDRKGARQCT